MTLQLVYFHMDVIIDFLTLYIYIYMYYFFKI